MFKIGMKMSTGYMLSQILINHRRLTVWPGHHETDEDDQDSERQRREWHVEFTGARILPAIQRRFARCQHDDITAIEECSTRQCADKRHHRVDYCTHLQCTRKPSILQFVHSVQSNRIIGIILKKLTTYGSFLPWTHPDDGLAIENFKHLRRHVKLNFIAVPEIPEIVRHQHSRYLQNAQQHTTKPGLVLHALSSSWLSNNRDW